MHDLKWSDTEKKIARAVFDIALQKELAATMARFKELALAATTPDDLWETERFLHHARRGIDDKYDYRYSQLPLLFARLVLENLIKREELQKLGQDKLAIIDDVIELNKKYLAENDE
ncbi:hypothetical protein ACO0LC_00635 [Undibacterium sp. JH2W]|uniref:hypothetical protein n=1 Tax=Undibacterium sp. JH2W TaxID=3413037 RepID=UPI003BF36288